MGKASSQRSGWKKKKKIRFSLSSSSNFSKDKKERTGISLKRGMITRGRAYGGWTSGKDSSGNRKKK